MDHHNTTNGTKMLVTADEAAGFLSLSRSQVYELAKRREIPSIRIGRSVRFPLDALRRWIDEKQADSGSPGIHQ